MKKSGSAFFAFSTLFVVLVSNLSAEQKEPGSDATAVARGYLEAVKLSDLKAVDTSATSAMVRWTRRYLPVVFEYKLVRGEAKCSEMVQFDEIKEQVLAYVEHAKKFSGLMETFLSGGASPRADELTVHKDGMEENRRRVGTKAACLGEVLSRGGHALFTDGGATIKGAADVRLYSFIVDIEKPGRSGARATERRDLAVAQIRSDTVTLGWKVINFGVFTSGR